MQKQLTALSTAAALPGAPGAPSSNYSALFDPRNDFVDRQAYRRDIRAAIAEAQLDDVHDRAGNALYRFQFQATVLPPDAATRQWAAARLQFQPPNLSVSDITDIYFGWLRHISGDMTQALRQKGASDGGLIRYLASADWSEYFKLIDIYYSPNSAQPFGCVNRRTSSAGEALPSEILGNYQYAATYAVPPSFGVRDNSDFCAVPFTGVAVVPKWLEATDVRTLYDWLGAPPPLPATDKSQQLPPMSRALEDFARTLARVQYFNEKPNATKQSQVQLRQQTVPVPFCRAVIAIGQNDWCNDFQDVEKKPFDTPGVAAEGGTPNGRRSYSVRSYSVVPLELAQRTGITSESSQSFQTAISVAAKLSQAATAGLDAGSLSQSDLRTQAILREPLVVGFAGSNNVSCDKRANKASFDECFDKASGNGSFFGWLFGPEFNVPDTPSSSPPVFLRWLYSPAKMSDTPKRLSLSQPVRTYGVTADVSFPSWWDYVKVEVRTAWVGNWISSEKTVDVIGDVGVVKTTKTVRLPVTDAAFADLTSFIAAEKYAVQTQPPAILSVTPDVLPTTCAGKIVLGIRGNNLWRAENVYLAGVAADSVEVWPNMAGISARFDLASVFGGTLNANPAVQTVPLVVATRQGDLTPVQILVVGKRELVNGSPNCQSPLLLPSSLTDLEPIVASVTPHEVCATDSTLSLVIDGVKLPSSYMVNSILFKPTPTNVSGSPLHRAIELAPKNDEKSLPLGTLNLVLVGRDGDMPPNGCKEQCRKPDSATCKECQNAWRAPGVLAVPISLNVVDCPVAAKAAAKAKADPGH
jgi:hypothetical protein